MTSVSLSDQGEKDLEAIRSSFDIEPSKRKVVERALKEYKNERLGQS